MKFGAIHGLVDFRARPDLAAEIPESTALNSRTWIRLYATAQTPEAGDGVA